MDIQKIKAGIFDTEQALTFAREAIDEKDTEALKTAVKTAQRELGHVCEEIERPATYRPTICAENHRPD